MKLNTTRFGEIEVLDDELLHLPQGLIGFPELTSFVLLNHDKQSPFKWFQSVDDGAIAFVLINPLMFRSDYSAQVHETEIESLQLESEEDAVISVIVTMADDPGSMTANLKAPLIFNSKNRLGKQVILAASEYQTRHNILDEIKEAESARAATRRSDLVPGSRAKSAVD